MFLVLNKKTVNFNKEIVIWHITKKLLFMQKHRLLNNGNYLWKSIVVSIVIAAAFSFLPGCKKTEQTATFIRPVRVDTVKLDNKIINNYSGIVDAAKYANLAFRVSSQIIELNVVEGQKVKKGEVLAVVDPREILLSLNAAKANYETNLSKLQRTKALLDKNAVSVQEVEVAQASFEQSKSIYAAQQNNYADTYMRAPFSGSIAKLKVENYQRVQAGEIIGQLIDSRDLQVNFTLPDLSLSLIEGGNKSFTVEFEVYRGIHFKADLKGYVEASPDGSGIPVFLNITDPRFSTDNYDIKPGFSCTVTMTVKIQNQNSEFPVIPITALFASNEANQTYVWVYNPQTGTVSQRQVITGGLVGAGNVLIKSGLAEDDIIVTAGVTQIIDGEQVKILQGP